VRATGSAREKISVSNVLALRGLAPHVQDVVLMSHKLSPPVSVVVVEHCGHDEPDAAEGTAFVDKLRVGVAAARIEVLGPGFDEEDFRAPSFRHNILRSPHGLRYVDIQNFVFRDYRATLRDALAAAADRAHWDESVPFRRSRYRYQSLPMVGAIGKRDTAARSKLIEELLVDVGCEIERANVLDVGCNLGELRRYFLHRGARWCSGVDTPEVAEVTRYLSSPLGFSRFDVVGCDLRQENPLDQLGFHRFDIVLCLSVAHHIGFPAWLHHLEWRFIVFEGPESMRLDECADQIQAVWPSAHVVKRLMTRDGDSAPRPLLLLAA
jgi:hypothetical protein